jgi:hypothetical protein
VVVWVGFLKEPLEPVRRRHRLTLVTMCGSRYVSPIGATLLHIVVIIVVDHSPLKALLHLFLLPSMPCWAVWVPMSDGASLSLLGVTSLLR